MTSAPSFQPQRARWAIIGVIFFATVSNYIDRQTLNVLSPLLLKEFELDKIQYSQIAATFLGAYTIGMTFWGRLFDRIGLRIGLAICIAAWSAVASLHALATGFISFLALRFLLGLTEAGNWPAAAKTISEWFPAHERAFAMGVFNNGSGIGAMIAPPVIVTIQLLYGWQATFLLTGGLGLIWLFVWLAVYRRPPAAPIVEGPRAPAPRWRTLLGYRQTWAVIGARIISDPIWWIYLVWLPQYLFDARGFDLKKIAAFAWAPFLAADLGALAGGFVAGLLIRRGLSINAARKICFLIGASLIPAGALVPAVESAMTALALISLVLFAYQFWINNVQSVPGDVFPSHAVGAVFGLGGTAAGVGSLLVMLAVGWVVQHFSYTPVFVAAAVMGPLGCATLLLLVGKIPERQIELAPEPLAVTVQPASS